MPFSISCGVGLLSLLLILPEPGRPQCYYPQPRSPGLVIPPCCMQVSTAHIREPIVSCFEQKENSFSHCRIHAFIFTTSNNSHHCVDPAARWLSRRFQRLQKRGICCH